MENKMVGSYFTMDLLTTKKGNHVLNTTDKDVLILDKMGKKVKSVYTKNIKGQEPINLYPSKPGTFIVLKFSDEKAVIVQICKVIRDIQEGYEEYNIQDIPYDAITHSAICYVLNEYSDLGTCDGVPDWEYSLIDRIEEEVVNFVF